MAKIEIVLDAAKLRDLITSREYTNKSNEVVKVQEVKFELVEVKEKKVVVSGAWGEKIKTHFACAIQTKEERAAKKETNYIGEGFTTNFSQSAPTAPTATNDDPATNLPF